MIIQRLFSSKAQKTRLKKLRLSEGRDPFSEIEAEQKEFGKTKIVNKAAKKAWESANKDSSLGEKAIGQFRKTNSSGLTLTKHELKGQIGIPTRIHEGNRVAEINLSSGNPTNNSINAKGINEHLNKKISVNPKNIMKTIHNDPKKGEFTRVRWSLK